MATTMKATFKVEVSGAGTSSASHIYEAEAFDKIEVSVPAGALGSPEALEVEVQPGAAGQVELLLISSDTYNDLLTYSVPTGSTDVPLDAPHLLVGAGAVGLLGAAPNSITFSNENEAPVEVKILVGRAAVPPPP